MVATELTSVGEMASVVLVVIDVISVISLQEVNIVPVEVSECICR